MNEIEKQTVNDVEPLGKVAANAPLVTPVSRRRLIKLGSAAVPVVATLASRPALAWHCKSPSAWGSEIINPNTSLKTNAGHNVYADETWTITNWKTNTPRTSSYLDGDEGVQGKPWTELKRVCTGLFNPQTTSTKPNGTQYFDYRKVTVDHLVAYVPGFINPGFAGSTLVKDIPDGDLKTYPLIAQLNYIVLKQVKFNNDIDMCLRDGQLGQMASGGFMEGGQSWTAQKVKDYLYNNWIVRP